MDSTAQTTPRDSELINELVSQVTLDATAQTAPRDSENINELLSQETNGFDGPNSP